MDIQVGSVVCSKAGRDKQRFFVVLALEGEFALIADGSLRKIASPKRKKLKHMAATATVFEPHQFASDKSLYHAIKTRFYSDDRHEEG